MSAPEPSPSLDEFRELYDAAARFKAIECWDWMDDTDLFGVRNPESGEVGYGCVMGAAGEHFALAVYQGAEGLQGYFAMARRGRSADPFELLLRQKCLMASFEDREELKSEDLQTIRQLGLKFRGRAAWPLFRGYRPGYEPWYVTRDEARFLTLSLQQAIEVALRFRDDPRLLAPSRRGKYLVRVPERAGDELRWRDEWLAPERHRQTAPVSEAVDDKRLESIRQTAVPVLNVWEVDYFYSPTAISGEGRPYFPYVLLCADHESGFVYGSDILRPHELPSRLVNAFLERIETQRQRPPEIRVRRDEAVALLKQVATRLEMRLRLVRDLPALEAARQSLLEFLRSG